MVEQGTQTETVNRAQLIRFMDDLMAGFSMGLSNYESSLDRIADEELRMKLGEFKADVAHDREFMRALIRHMGGEPSPGKVFAASVGARIQTLIGGNMGNDAYAASVVLGELAAGEEMARIGLSRLEEIGQRINDNSLREFARESLRRSETRKDYLERRHADMMREALFGTQRRGATTTTATTPTGTPSATGGSTRETEKSKAR